MSDALYERYKESLRRGHVAAQRGRHEAALEAYAEAAQLAPDRALPLVGLGTVLAELGRHGEALTAFDAALERAPADVVALRGRADALSTAGDRVAAAETVDRLASVLEAAGRRTDALDAGRQALELAESRGRRASVRSLLARLATDPADPDPDLAEALARTLGVLEGRVGEPEPAPPEPPPPFDQVGAIAAVEVAAEGDDASATRALALAAASGYRAAGLSSAAIDACYLALGTNPADPGLHLALADLYLDQGWDPAAADKLRLLARLAELTDDVATRDRVCLIATERLADDPDLMRICT